MGDRSWWVSAASVPQVVNNRGSLVSTVVPNSRTCPCIDLPSFLVSLSNPFLLFPGITSKNKRPVWELVSQVFLCEGQGTRLTPGLKGLSILHMGSLEWR